VRTIGILLFEDVEELDAVGPWEVLSFWSNRHPEDGWRVVTFSADGKTVRCAKGLRVVPDHSYDDVPELEVLVYPGGRGARAQVEDGPQIAWVREQREKVPLLTSVCTGALVYAKAGLLAGRPATTHWRALDLLSALDSTIEVRDDARFVDAGDVVTSAGISAGIDMALHLVARLESVDAAKAVRRGIQYDPEPPV
jgi:transcriptional regulator GlxA family with amidase domain